MGVPAYGDRAVRTPRGFDYTRTGEKTACGGDLGFLRENSFSRSAGTQAQYRSLTFYNPVQLFCAQRVPSSTSPHLSLPGGLCTRILNERSTWAVTVHCLQRRDSHRGCEKEPRAPAFQALGRSHAKYERSACAASHQKGNGQADAQVMSPPFS